MLINPFRLRSSVQPSPLNPSRAVSDSTSLISETICLQKYSSSIFFRRWIRDNERIKGSNTDTGNSILSRKESAYNQGSTSINGVLQLQIVCVAFVLSVSHFLLFLCPSMMRFAFECCQFDALELSETKNTVLSDQGHYPEAICLGPWTMNWLTILHFVGARFRKVNSSVTPQSNLRDR